MASIINFLLPRGSLRRQIASFFYKKLTGSTPPVQQTDTVTDSIANTQSAEKFLIILDRIGFDLASDAKILDFGCGAGGMVLALRDMGHDVAGFDLFNYLNDSANLLPHLFSFLDPKGSFSGSYVIDWSNFKLPYPDNYFDAVFSSQVFEHIQAHEPVIKEFGRVLKKKGVSINIFPPRAYPVEQHIRVPFGHIIHSRTYYWLMAALGCRNQFQHDLKIKEIAQLNYGYVRDSLNYLPNKTLLKLAKKYFVHAEINQKAHYNITCDISAAYQFYLNNFKPNICLVMADKKHFTD